MYDFLSSLSANVIALQECGLCSEYDFEKAKKDWTWTFGCSVWSSDLSCKNSGVGLLFCSFDFEIISYYEIEPGRAILVKVNYQNKVYRFMNIYAPTEKEARY